MTRRSIAFGLGAIVAALLVAVLVEASLWRRARSRQTAVATEAGDDGGVAARAPTVTPNTPAPPAAAATVRGSVVDENGRPVAGAVVEVAGEGEGGAAGLEKSGELGILRGPIPYPPPQPSAFAARQGAARSDAYGNFVIAGVAAGRVVVTASHSSFSSGVSEPLLLVAGQEARVTVRVRRGVALSGRVVDERGNPVAGAHVEVATQPLPRSADSDRSGSFVVAGLDPGAHDVVVAHPDFCPASYRAVDSATELDVTLVPGGGIEGVARDARTGGAPRGLTLTFTSAGQPPRLLPVASGRFRATALPAGKATLTAVAPGYVTATQSIEVPAGSGLHEVTLRDLSLELMRGGSASVCVRDDRGDRLAGAALTLGSRTAVTRDDGCARVDGIAAGRVRVSVDKDGRAASEEIEVRADEESRVELRLR